MAVQSCLQISKVVMNTVITHLLMFGAQGTAKHADSHTNHLQSPCLQSSHCVMIN